MKITYVYIALIVLIAGGLIVARNANRDTSAESTTEFDSFAQCLTDAGAKFYGAFWCPHCNDQKALLKNSKQLPYIECSTLDRQSQTPPCIDAGITSYPTWTFVDGSKVEGVMDLEKLADKTRCTLLPSP